ncbi:MAG: efflux RND transporter periplasmic adaptor subunit [Hyphomicrobiales bacterium]|nr:efflux RND transporter periplasmic adaptor subunit [Hyphomicrobiales bacterium]
MKLSGRLTTAAVVVATIVAGGWWWTTRKTADPLADILTAKVETGDIRQTVQATGTLRPVRLVAVGAQVSGRITSMKVAIGDRVKAGDLVATIDSVPQENDLKTARAALDDVRAQKRQKEASLVYALAVLERETTTYAKQASSKDSFESARATVETTRAQIDSLTAQIAQAEVKVASAEVDLGYTRIVAPIDGTVLLVVAQEGQTVNAVQSAPTIVVVGRIDRMTVRAEISEADAPKVAIGQKVSFSILGALDRRWRAELAALDPAPDSLRSDSAISTSTTSSSSSSSSSASSSAIYYYGRFDVPNDDGVLRTYMTAQVEVVLGEAHDVLTVPTAALSPAGPKGERTVDVVGSGGAISRRPVAVGLDDKVRCEIRSGLAAGETVVVGRRSTEAKTSSMPPPPGGL